MPDELSPDDFVVLNRSATVARLLAGAAHELNNALQVIGGSVELLDDATLPEQARIRIGRIRAQHDRAATVVHNLVSFARERTEGVARVGLRELLTRAVGLRAYAAGRAGLQLALTLPEGSALTVQGNAMELQQAVLNLIANAEQALAGTTGGSIRVVLAEEAGGLALRVIDNGPGVPEALRARIFEPFFTTGPRSESAGLGLAAAARIAARAGGSLTLEPEGPGASFVLRLPVA